jgi:DNA-binding IscR family transcriptional regulator
VRGGYVLGMPADKIPVSEVLYAIEGTGPSIAQCMQVGAEECNVASSCTIKSPLEKVQAHIEKAFSQMTVSEIM